jgi:hypothetical protein
MMGIIQTLTEQDIMSLHRTLFYTMESSATDKMMTCTKEEIGVVRREVRESIKCMAIDGHGYGCGEHRTFVEGKPVGMMIV